MTACLKRTQIVKRLMNIFLSSSFKNSTEAFFKGKYLLPALISGRYIKTGKHLFPISLISFLAYSFPRRLKRVYCTNIFRNSLQQIRRISVSVKKAMSGKVGLSNDIQWSPCDVNMHHWATEKFDGTIDTMHGDNAISSCYFSSTAHI